jgi:hypothetical protein
MPSDLVSRVRARNCYTGATSTSGFCPTVAEGLRDALKVDRKVGRCIPRRLPVYARSKQTSGMPPLKRMRNLSAGVFVIWELHRVTEPPEAVRGGQLLRAPFTVPFLKRSQSA